MKPANYSSYPSCFNFVNPNENDKKGGLAEEKMATEKAKILIGLDKKENRPLPEILGDKQKEMRRARNSKFLLKERSRRELVDWDDLRRKEAERAAEIEEDGEAVTINAVDDEIDTEFKDCFYQNIQDNTQNIKKFIHRANEKF